MATNKTLARFVAIINRALFRTDSTLGYARTLDAIVRLAEEVSHTETDESTWELGSLEGAGVSDMLAGAYWFTTHHHSGQWSPEYKAMCVIGRVFSPGCCRGPEPESSECDVYESLRSMAGFSGESEEG